MACFPVTSTQTLMEEGKACGAIHLKLFLHAQVPIIFFLPLYHHHQGDHQGHHQWNLQQARQKNE